MNKIKFLAGVGAVWLGLLGSSLQAYVVDWTKPYPGTVIDGQMKGVDLDTRVHVNLYDWIRSVQFWQSFHYIHPGKTLSGISLELQYAKAGSSMDLNIYEGSGVDGVLISSTKLQWTTDFPGGWYAFKLGVPVPLKNRVYTVAVENLSSDDAIGVVVQREHVGEQSYMQQGYFGMRQGRDGYDEGVNNAALNYALLE